MHQSKTTWAGIQTKTIVEPVSGQIKGAQSQDRFRLRGLAQPPLLRLEISESPGFIRIPGFQPLPPGLGERATLFYRHTKRLCWSSKPFAELSCIAIFQFIPWDQLGQLDPAVVTREFPAKRQEEVFKRELVAMLTPVHIENARQFADVITILDDHTITGEK